MPPMDIPPGRFAVVEDNQGAIFAILRFAEA
jgi:predicted enzyme related to lactoylglutathione lyase